jgi:hypothetical protein
MCKALVLIPTMRKTERQTDRQTHTHTHRQETKRQRRETAIFDSKEKLKARVTAQVLECLPSKHKALNSNSRICLKKKKEKLGIGLILKSV